MSNYEHDDFDNHDDDQEPRRQGPSPAELRILRKKEKEYDTLAARLAEMERREAIRGAGLTLNPRQEKALLAAHDGEIDAESLKVTATELGFIAPTPEKPDTPEEEQAAHQRLSLVGGSGVNDGKGDPVSAMYAASSPEEVLRIAQAAGGRVESAQ